MDMMVEVLVSKNPIINYLNYWIMGEVDKNSTDVNTRSENYRKENDIDAKWLSDVHADNLFSAWLPLKMTVQALYYPKKGLKLYPNKSIYPKDFLSWIKVEIMNGNLQSKSPVLYSELEKFFSLASKRENVIRLPNQAMQKRIKWYDQVPKFLYECFEGGEFAGFFNNDDSELVKWVETEHLEYFFKDNIISKDTIKPLISGMKPYEYEWLFKEDDLLALFRNYNELLETRGKFYN